LAVHETAEEEVVHPAARRATGGDAVVDDRLREEDEAKSALATLEDLRPNHPDFGPKLDAFEQAVIAHAEAEEGQEFPLIAAITDLGDRQRLASAVQAAERMAPTHPHPHGPESGIGNLLAGPFVAIVDRVRDAIRGHAA
jgi:hemerythrin superfamily protein